MTGQRVPWMDWKPVTGENAWANLIGPVQTAHLRLRSTGAPWSFDLPEIQLALRALTAFEAMQSDIGALYYAPAGTYHAAPGAVSTENCISSFAGLRMLKAALVATNDTRAAPFIVRVGNLMEAVTTYMQLVAFDESVGVFVQGGVYNTGDQTWSPENTFAVDVQTWGISVFAAEIDQVRGWSFPFRSPFAHAHWSCVDL